MHFDLALSQAFKNALHGNTVCISISAMAVKVTTCIKKCVRSQVFYRPCIKICQHTTQVINRERGTRNRTTWSAHSIHMQVAEELGSSTNCTARMASLRRHFHTILWPRPLSHFLVHFKCNSAYAFGSAAEFVCYLLWILCCFTWPTFDIWKSKQMHGYPLRVSTWSN